MMNREFAYGTPEVVSSGRLQTHAEINQLLDTKIQQAADTLVHIVKNSGLVEGGVQGITGEDLSSKAIPSVEKKRRVSKQPKHTNDTLLSGKDESSSVIGLFYADDIPGEETTKQDKRTQNGNINDLRENVLVFLANCRELPEEYAQDPRWVHLHTELHKVLQQVRSEETAVFVKKAGRMYNYDFEYTCGSRVVKYEFKFCAHPPRIDALPQIYQGTTSSTNIFREGFPTFDEYYYDNGLSKYCEFVRTPKQGGTTCVDVQGITGENLFLHTKGSIMDDESPLPMIDKPTYLKHVKSASSTQPFFVQLKSQYSKNVDEKNAIVNGTIANYLQECQTHVNLDAVSELLQKQKDKTYLMWHPKTRQFYTEEIPEHELNITRVSHITKNTIVFVADTYSYSFLLRWKNGKGVLNPAWQVSVNK